MSLQVECPVAPLAVILEAGLSDDGRAICAGGRIVGVEVVDDPSSCLFPTPMDVAGRDEVLVGRVRRDFESNRLWLWQVSDNLRKGAATNAVQIAEALRERPPVVRR